jgi:hypothetical protein
MPAPTENVCVLLMQLYEMVEAEKSVSTEIQSKQDFCDNVNARVTSVIQQMLCTPYTMNFNLRIQDQALQ